jgi:phosphoribosylanthranilate isomerase
MHPLRIKNCGLTTPETVMAAAESGAALVGFVHHPPSVRHAAIDLIAKLIACAPPNLATVLVMVRPELSQLDILLARFRPHYLQVHGITEPARIGTLSAHTNLPIITALHADEGLGHAAALEEVSAHLLFDAAVAGSGESFDWQPLQKLTLRKPWFLAGGLTAENVHQAIAATKAPMVDVSSGIEVTRGVKSIEKMTAFNRAALAAYA